MVPGNRFDSLLAFLKEQEAIYEQLEDLREEEPRKAGRFEPRHARTRAIRTNDAPAGLWRCKTSKEAVFL